MISYVNENAWQAIFSTQTITKTPASPLGPKISKPYLVPWREEPVPVSEWIAVPLAGNDWRYTPAGNFFYFPRDSKLVGVRFDAKTRSLGQPFDVKFPPSAGWPWGIADLRSLVAPVSWFGDQGRENRDRESSY